LTLAFSKKPANLKASVALHHAHYNFVRANRTLRCTPAMVAGVTDRLWSVEELIEEANLWNASSLNRLESFCGRTAGISFRGSRARLVCGWRFSPLYTSLCGLVMPLGLQR
jgi:hypothetical protein